jgi:DNA mismatch endonuclease (patch repair protein)
VVFPSERVVAFVDGCFWHGCPLHWRSPVANSAYWEAKVQLNQARDRRNDGALTAAGWLVVRVWEHENTEAAALKVRRLVERRRQSVPAGSAP